MRSRSLVAALGSVLLVAGCASTPPPAIPTTAEDAPAWTALDRHLPRDLLVAHDRWFGNHRGLLAADELAAVPRTPDADSLVAAWPGSLSVAEQTRRRHAAGRRRDDAIAQVLTRVERLVRAPGPTACAMLDTTLLGVVRGLEGAVRSDPDCEDAWHDLARFRAVIGDEGAASTARRRYLDLALGVDFDARARRCRVVLDEAWHLRESGRQERCRLWLMGHSRLLNTTRHLPDELAPRVERDLIMGLVSAEQGRLTEAGRWLQRLPLVPVTIDGEVRRSEYLRTWVHAWAQLHDGNELAVDRFLAHTRIARLHASVGWRYWQDLGLAAEAVGQPSVAQTFWDRAHRSRPYVGFYPQSIAPGPGDVLGATGAGLPSRVAYHTHLITGSVWSFTVGRALLCQRWGPDETPALWRAADRMLERCIRRGIHPGEARLLRARLALQRGELGRAEADLDHPTVTRLAAGEHTAYVALLRGVTALAGHDTQLARSLLVHAVAAAPNQAIAGKAASLLDLLASRGDGLRDSTGPRRWLLPTAPEIDRATALMRTLATLTATVDAAETIAGHPRSAWVDLLQARLRVDSSANGRRLMTSVHGAPSSASGAPTTD
ncbi:hypothetical protein GF314_14375 [bacterium]|nr:hypothetical protein [bacterium]